MDPHFGELELFSNDIVKKEVMDSVEGQMRLTTGKNDNCPGTSLVKTEVEDEEMWKYGCFSTNEKADFENPKPKRMKLASGVETSIYKSQKERKAEAKYDNRVFNAHDFLTNEFIVKEELESLDGNSYEEPHPRNTVSGNKEKGQTDDSEKQEDMETMCPVDGCSEKSSSFEWLKKHMKIHPHPLVCRVCRKTCPSAYALRLHHRIHFGKQAQQCAICYRKFATTGNLKVHVRQHTEELLFGCDMCGGNFKDSSNLKDHLLNHCTEARHMRTHTVQKRFECTDCGQFFSLRQYMEEHKAAVHLGLKKHACKECEYKTAYHSTFVRHIKRKHPY